MKEALVQFCKFSCCKEIISKHFDKNLYLLSNMKTGEKKNEKGILMQTMNNV